MYCCIDVTKKNLFYFRNINSLATCSVIQKSSNEPYIPESYKANNVPSYLCLDNRKEFITVNRGRLNGVSGSCCSRQRNPWQFITDVGQSKRAYWFLYSKMWPNATGHCGIFGIMHLTYCVWGLAKYFPGILGSMLVWVLESRAGIWFWQDCTQIERRLVLCKASCMLLSRLLQI